MTRKQTRRAISIKSASYDRIKAYCAPRGISMSSFVEDRFAEFVVGIERHADDNEEAETESTESKPFVQSGLTKDKLKPYNKEPIRGGGVHEF